MLAATPFPLASVAATAAGKKDLVAEKGGLGAGAGFFLLYIYIFPSATTTLRSERRPPKKLPTDRPTTPLPPLFSSTCGARETQKWLN